MYKRKTTDEYDIMADYGQGWELVNCETTRKDARRSVKEYRENEGYPCKIVKHRVKIQARLPKNTLEPAFQHLARKG